jgi:hypothetical protein
MSRRAVALALVVAIPILACAGASVAAEPSELTVVPGRADSGQWVTVIATGLPDGARTVVQLCGTADPDALERCDGETTINAVADRSGTATTPLRVSPPESGCPCLIEVLSADGRAAVLASAPITVDGVEGPTVGRLGFAPIRPGGPPLTIVYAEIKGGSSWSSWFGAGSSRTLTYTIKNTADTQVVVGPVALTGVPPGLPPEALPSPPVGVLEPGQRRTIRVNIQVGTLEWGDYQVAGQVSQGSTPVPFGASTSFSPPWGLLLSAVIALELALLVAWRWLRRRISIDLLGADPSLPRRVSRAVVAGTLLERHASEIAQSITGRVLADETSASAPSTVDFSRSGLNARSDNPDES